MKRLIVLLLGAVACSATGTPPQAATVEVVIPPAAATAPEPTVRSNGKRSGRCSVALTTQHVQMSSPTCYLDQRIEDGGVLTYPCSGEDGEVTARFDKLEYAGTIRGGEVELEKRTELDWPGDSCRWGTIGTIRGPLLEGGEISRQKLQWTYADRVVSGTNCSGTCRATAILDVSEPE